MLSHLRRGQPHHHHEFDGNSMPVRTTNGHVDHWKTSDRANSSVLSNNLGIDAYPIRSIPGGGSNPDLSRALRVDAYLLAIVRVEDKRNAFYSAEVVSKLRQKEQTQSFINKPCSLFVTDRSLVIFDRATQTIAESIPLENVDPTCVHADVPDQLNDIFMYRLLDRQLTTTASQASSTNSNDTSPVVVFKCANNEARMLVDGIRTTIGKPIKQPKSSGAMEHRFTGIYTGGGISGGGGGGGGGGGSNLMQQLTVETPAPPPPPPQMNNPSYMMTNQQTRMATQQSHVTSQQAHVTSQQTHVVTQQTAVAATDHYKRLTEELNKCFDDIELFVRYLEALTEYTKELERDHHRRKEKKSTMGLKNMIEKIPDDRYFIDILQKFKHSFNLLGELKHIIHNPNAPELIHYLLSPLQFILHTLRTKHTNQLQLAREIWSPAFTRETRDLLLNCLTSKEHDILRNLGPAWVRAADESVPKFSDYRPVFFDGRAVWIQENSIEYPPAQPLQAVRSTERSPTTHPFTQFDERSQSVWTSTRQSNLIDHGDTNGLVVPQNTTFIRQPSSGHFDTSTVDRTVKSGILENYNSHMQNQHAWAIDRKRAGARICAVKIDRQGQNSKELTVHRGELIEIEDSSKKWWYARNFRGEIGYVPNNILEEIEIEHRPIKISPSIPSAANSHRSITNTNIRSRYN